MTLHRRQFCRLKVRWPGVHAGVRHKSTSAHARPRIYIDFDSLDSQIYVHIILYASRCISNVFCFFTDIMIINNENMTSEMRLTAVVVECKSCSTYHLYRNNYWCFWVPNHSLMDLVVWNFIIFVPEYRSTLRNPSLSTILLLTFLQYFKAFYIHISSHDFLSKLT